MNSAQTTPETGSFLTTSPTTQTPEQSEDQEVPQAFHPPTLTILMVEDDGELMEMTKAVVANWGWPVRLVVAKNGSDGLLQAGLNRPVVIVTDLMMPDMDGFQMLKSLSEMPDLQVSRVVVVTGMDDQHIAANGGVPTGVEILHKPTPYDRLKEIVLTSTMFTPSACSRTVQ
ncbi:MAG: response regulator [Magnetococcales bacterium]|nr:response regulator [Magnetococcales bacterium]